MKKILSLLLSAILLSVQPSLAVVMVGFGSEPPDPTIIVNDALDENSDVAITSHTVSPGPGGTWSLVLAQGITVGTDGARADGASASTAITSDVMTDGYVEVVGTTGNATSGVWFAPGRMTAANSGYTAVLYGNGSFGIYRTTTGSSTLLGSITPNLTIPSISTPIRVRITFSGDQISAEAWDGTTSLGTRGPFTDSTHTTGSPSLRFNATASRVTQFTAGT